MKRANAVFICVLLTLQFFMADGACAEPQVVGESAVLMDAKTGQVLYQKNPDKKMYPASTTKMLTALVALERGNLEDEVTASSNAVNTAGSAIGLQTGEKLTLEHLLYALMLVSANDAAEAIAEHLAGTVEQFCHIMNDTARLMGARNTHFTNPHGLPDENHYTTAYDLAVIARHAMKNTEFMKIAGAKSKIISRDDPEAWTDLYNHNSLLSRYEHAVGIKTGYTRVAQQCIVAAAEKDGRELIAVVLKTKGVNIWSDAITLLEYGFNNFQPHKLIDMGEVVDRVKVNYSKEEIDLVAADHLYYNFPVGYQPNLVQELELYDEPEASLDSGQVLGSLLLYEGDHYLTEVEVLASKEVKRPLSTYWWFWVGIMTTTTLLMVTVLYLFMKLKRLKFRRIR
ncbi:D-alanyl-D-alanine carboxypeptidase family protein [Desulfofalx alkaliphila]|uniref:D-alanyl-D-alanine carboxypeptidase family protein n=1 Tax=Desulfofalx alkaliphila TaxID=105483 RepID=UPI0004E1391A|nr:D-alanyl-D-alanine carboxypeptidase family protein [Desulfofalx alkaliphila]